MADSRINQYLTPSAYRMLEAMRDGKDNYAISEGSQVWVDTNRFTRGTLDHLLRLCLVRRDSFSNEVTETWTVNEEGRRIIDDIFYVPMILRVR
jgi:hypothetical protein